MLVLYHEYLSSEWIDLYAPRNSLTISPLLALLLFLWSLLNGLVLVVYFLCHFKGKLGRKEINTDSIYCLDSVHWLSLRERILVAVRRVNAWKVKQEASNSGSSDHSVGK